MTTALYFMVIQCLFFTYTDWLQVVRVFEIVALGASLFATFLIVIHLVLQKFSQTSRVYFVSFVSCFVTGKSFRRLLYMI